MRVPPNCLISSTTLSGVTCRISTHRAAVPGLSVSPRLFMKLSSMPTSRKAPATAPAAAPTAMPNSGLRKIRPMGILSRGGFLVLDDLLRAGLADIDDGFPTQMGVTDLGNAGGHQVGGYGGGRSVPLRSAHGGPPAASWAGGSGR